MQIYKHRAQANIRPTVEWEGKINKKREENSGKDKRKKERKTNKQQHLWVPKSEEKKMSRKENSDCS